MTRRPWPKVQGILIRVKRPLYWLGFRPKQGSIFFSPSLAIIYGVWDSARIDPEGTHQ